MKAIITASYDREEGDLIAKAKAQYEKEKEAGYYLPTPVFLRGRGQEVTKFNYLIPIGSSFNDRVPMIAFSMLGLSKAGLEDIVVVGDKTTGEVVDKFNEYFRTRIKFGPENEDLSFSETLNKGREALELEENEKVYVLMGDVPLKFDFRNVIDDPDIDEYDLISDMNSKMRTNRFWPRRFHWRLTYNGVPYMVKESQDLIVDLDRMDKLSEDLGLEGHVFDLLYKGRKAYSKKGKSREEMFRDVITQNYGKIALSLAVAPWYSHKLKRFYFKKGKRGPLPLSSRGIYKMAKVATGAKILLKSIHNDPAMIADVDGLSDWSNIGEMLATRRNVVQPNAVELSDFGRNVMPSFRRENEFYYGFEDYMNGLFREFEMPEPFVNDGEFRNPYTSGEMDVRTTRRAKTIVRKSSKKHRRYVRRNT